MTATKLSTAILRDIANRIVYGEIGADGKLPSYKELAAEFRASTVSVREAVVVLEALGIVEIRHGLGIFVRDQEHLFEDVFRSRREIECSISREAARRIDDEGVRRLQGLVESLDEAARAYSWELYASRDDVFHQCIIEISGLRTLGTVATLIKSALFTPGAYREIEAAKDPRYLLHANESHWAMFRALEARNAELASSSTAGHLERVYSLWVKNFSEMRRIRRSGLGRP